jgi:DNA polymerase alpha subunit B
VPNTPGTGKLNKGSSLRKKAYETPSISRVKAEPPSSSPDYKTPMRMQDQLNSMTNLP